jgi:hypothetical protein
LSAQFVVHGTVNSIHPQRNDRKTPPATASILEVSSVLGIRDLRSNDSSINSLDGSVSASANVGAIFRQNQESQRRVRATWNSPQDNVTNQNYISGEGTAAFREELS